MSSHRCRLCGANLTHTFVDLGMSPLRESYVAADQTDAPEVFYPLHVRLCAECLLVQLPAYVSGEHIFSNYAYFPGLRIEACPVFDPVTLRDRRGIQRLRCGFPVNL